MHFKQLTFTRFIAALAIVVFHYGRKIPPFNNGKIAFIFQHANLGVSYFYILSGFVMIIAYHKKERIDFLEFIKNRLARIYPVYLISLFLLFLLKIGDIDSKGLTLNFLMIQAWFPKWALSFNYPGWSLSVEFFFYATFPLFFNYFYKKASFKTILITVSLFWLVSQLVFNYLLTASFLQNSLIIKLEYLFYNPFLHLNSFLIGNLCGLFIVGINKIKFKNYDFPILALGILLLISLRFPLHLNYHNGLLALIFVPFIILLSLNNGILTTVFGNRILVFLGEVSYGFYILQYPVFDYLSKSEFDRFYIHLHPTIVFFIKVLVLLLFASLNYLFLEDPIRKKIKSLKVKRLPIVTS